MYQRMTEYEFRLRLVTWRAKLRAWVKRAKKLIGEGGRGRFHDEKRGGRDDC